MTKKVWSKHLVLCITLLIVLLANNIGLAAKLTMVGPFNNFTKDLKVALDGFTARYGVEVEVISTREWKDKVMVMSAAGEAPDVIYGDGTHVSNLAVNNLTMPIDELVARDNIKVQRYPKPVIDWHTYKGALYGLPTALSPHVTYFNPEHYRQVGLNRPPTNWASNDWLWDDFVTTMRKLTRDTDGDGKINQYGADGMGWPGGMNFLFLWGLTWTDKAVTEFYGDTAAVISAVEQMSSLWTKHDAMGGSILQGTASNSLQQAFFINTLLLQSKMFEWDLAILPKATHRVTYSGFHGLAISNQTKQVDMAWNLVRWLAYDTEGAIPFSRAENRVPVLPETARDFVNRFQNKLPNVNWQVITDSVHYAAADAYLFHPKSREIFTAIVDAGRQILRKEDSVRTIMEGIAPKVRSYIAER